MSYEIKLENFRDLQTYKQKDNYRFRSATWN